MRKNQAAAPTADSCHRCTAILRGEGGRCTMCGWPVGVTYPTGDGQLTAEVPLLSTEPDNIEDSTQQDHTGAQLDALSSMVDRQTMTRTVGGESTAATSKTVETLTAEKSTMAGAESADQAAAVEAPELVMAHADTTTSPVLPVTRPSVKLDPLTAPLEELEAESPRDYPVAPPTSAAAPAETVGSPADEVITGNINSPSTEDVASYEADHAEESDDSETTGDVSKPFVLLVGLLIVLAAALVGAYTLL